MKRFISLLFITLAGVILVGASNRFIQTSVLDDRVVYSVPVATNRVTTISFPGPIEAIDAANVTTDGKTPGQFQLAHTKGSTFLSVRALAPGAAANLNIRWNEQTFVFTLFQTNAPVLALNLVEPDAGDGVLPAPDLTPAQLLGLLDEAKAFPLLKSQHPEAMADVQARTFGDHPQITEFSDYDIRIKEVFRFDTEDTLVFHVTLRNKSRHEIRYLPGSFRVRVGDRLYYQSISDAPGVLPPASASTVYFAITGTPDGGRNDISLKNTFMVFVTRLGAVPEAQTTTTHSAPHEFRSKK